MLPYLVKEKIYENLNLDDSLNFQIAHNEIFYHKTPSHEKLAYYICPVCALTKIDLIVWDFCKNFGENKFFVSKNVYQKIKKFTQKLQYQTGRYIAWSEPDLTTNNHLESLIDHINNEHLDQDTRKIFQVVNRNDDYIS